jgi:hypothetical protein
MPTVNRSRSTSAASRLTDNRRTQGERKQMLELLSKTISDLGSNATKNKADLDRETYYCVKTPGGDFIADFHLEGQERWDISGFNSFSVDAKKGEFYFTDYNDTYGPLKLPQGFHYPALFPNTRKDPAARTKGHKALKSLTKAIFDQEPQVYGKPWVDMDYDSAGRTWRTAAGGKLHKATPYDKRYSYGSQSFMFDLRKREFWLEQIPGVSGQCMGPFKLPAGFKKEDITALDKLDYSSTSTSTSTSTSDDYDSGSSRPSGSVIGSDDSDAGYTGPRLRDYVGGGGSGNAMNVYFRGRGGGGGGS